MRRCSSNRAQQKHKRKVTLPVSTIGLHAVALHSGTLILVLSSALSRTLPIAQSVATLESPFNYIEVHIPRTTSWGEYEVLIPQMTFLLAGMHCLR